jgi:preprotein translocase subunit SecF
MSRIGELGNRLYNGEVSYDFVGRRRRWYAISGAILLVALGGLLLRELDLGIEFRGGSEFQLASPGVTVEDGRAALAEAGIEGEPTVQILGEDTLRIQTQELDTEATRATQQALAAEFGLAPSDVSTSFVGPSWGADISEKALRGLVIFLVLVAIYLSLAFEWKMAVAALVALIHDVVITIGIYALVGFEVTPASVIGLLTILGFSLYDTVVVFDKVRENTAGIAGGSRATYSEAANLALNQTLVRSINTSIIGLLPVAAVLFVGAGLLGAGTLKDLALALFVGIAAGTYSSIFIATPLLADLKEREPQMQGLARRVAARRSGVDAGAGRGRVPDRPGRRPAGASAAPAAAPVPESESEPGSGSGAGPDEGGGAGATSLAVLDAASPRGPRNQPRRRTRGRPSGKKRR